MTGDIAADGLDYLSDSDDFTGPAYEVFHCGRPIGRVEQATVPSGEPGRSCVGWRFEHVDGRFGVARTRNGAVVDAAAQRRVSVRQVG